MCHLLNTYESVVTAKCFKISADHLNVTFFEFLIVSFLELKHLTLVVVHLLKCYCLPFFYMLQKLYYPHTVTYNH